MKQTGVKILLIGLTALGLSAGVVAGMLVSRLPAATAGAGQPPPSVFAIAAYHSSSYLGSSFQWIRKTCSAGRDCRRL